MLILEYAVIGRDEVFSSVPVYTTPNGTIETCDALYDFIDTPYMVEMYQIALPEMVDEVFENSEAEYFNPKTRLYARISETGE